MENNTGRCKHCGKPIVFYKNCGFWYHETSDNKNKYCLDDKNLAEPLAISDDYLRDLPITANDWIDVIGKEVTIKARNTLDNGLTVVRGRIVEVSFSDRKFKLSDSLSRYYINSIEAFILTK